MSVCVCEREIERERERDRERSREIERDRERSRSRERERSGQRGVSRGPDVKNEGWEGERTSWQWWRSKMVSSHTAPRIDTHAGSKCVT
eukprot:3938482-Rhodomonas_salina.1